MASPHPAGAPRYPFEIATERLTLRDPQADDRDALGSWTADAEVVRFLPFGPLEGTALDGYLDQIMGEADEAARYHYTLMIEETDTGEVLGSVSLSIDSPQHRRAEIGFVLRRTSWGRGFASEAAGAMIDFGFDHLGMHRVWAICVVDNTASMAVLERVGMVREGSLSQHLLIAGEFRDTYLYARVAEADRYL